MSIKLSQTDELIVLSSANRYHLLKRLNEQREIWEKSKPQDYKYIWNVNCFCEPGPQYGPNQITVEKGILTNVVFKGKKTIYNEVEDQTNDLAKFTIEDLFVKATEILNEEAWFNSNRKVGNKIKEEFLIEFDDEFGFPYKIHYSAPSVTHSGYKLVIENFVSL